MVRNVSLMTRFFGTAMVRCWISFMSERQAVVSYVKCDSCRPYMQGFRVSRLVAGFRCGHELVFLKAQRWSSVMLGEEVGMRNSSKPF